jgi:methylmalonic aciduria homocystinuria type C protein
MTVALTESLRAACRDAGFDLLQPARVGAYNRVVEPALRLEDFGDEDHLVLVVGNTRALWPVLLDALRHDPQLASAPDPLDAYSERSLTRLVAALGVPASLRFAHEGGDRRVAIQRLAHVAGLAYETETHQSVHATYGPWIALRAAISVAALGPPQAPPLAHPCGSCERGCRPAFERALLTLDGAPSEQNLRARWHVWLDCRDTCPIGREHRYSDAQIRYHYTRSRDVLSEAMAQTSASLEKYLPPVDPAQRSR